MNKREPVLRHAEAFVRTVVEKTSNRRLILRHYGRPPSRRHQAFPLVTCRFPTFERPNQVNHAPNLRGNGSLHRAGLTRRTRNHAWLGTRLDR